LDLDTFFINWRFWSNSRSSVWSTNGFKLDRQFAHFT